MRKAILFAALLGLSACSVPSAANQALQGMGEEQETVQVKEMVIPDPDGLNNALGTPKP